MSKLSKFIKEKSRKYCCAVVLAAGSSSRMGQDKLEMKIGKVPVLALSLQALNKCGSVDEIIVVSQFEKLESVSQLCRLYGITKAKSVVVGGATRTESALAGVNAASKEAKIICIHDGARPFANIELIDEVVRAAVLYNAAAPAVSVKDTIRVMRDGEVLDTPDRNELMAVQTPQAFDADIIKGALTAAVQSGISYTDDCAAVEALGLKVRLTNGSEDNIKITTPLDISVAEAIAAKRRKAEND